LEPNAPSTAPARVLVFAAGGEWVAVIVDAVLDVRPMDPGDMVPPPKIFRGLSAEYLRGLIRRDGDLVVVLDVDRLLSADEQLILQGAASAVPGESGS
jgi:purine-binding chemotaxis protein CheW